MSLPTTSWAKDATVYTAASSTPSVAGSSISPRRRSASSWPLPLVVKLKMRLLEIAARVITRSTRAITARGRSIDFFGRLAGGVPSRGTSARNRRPQRRAMPPGTANAARHPTCFTRKPVRIAAIAMPGLPARPLTPIVNPGFRACCTSMGMPTGW